LNAVTGVEESAGIISTSGAGSFDEADGVAVGDEEEEN